VSEPFPVARWGRQAWGWLRRLAGAPPEERVDAALQPPASPFAKRPSVVPSLDLAGVEKQLSKLGREQFKASALAEAQQHQVQSALEQLREQDERREKERAEWLARRPLELAETRQQVLQRLLPMLDGLDEALAAGERLLGQSPSLKELLEVNEQANERLPLGVNVIAMPLLVLGLLFPGLTRGRKRKRQQAITQLAAEMAAWKESQVAWLRGLELVRERLLETLAAEGVKPIETIGRPFDPHRHTALGAVPASPEFPPGTIVSELRRGYAAGTRVLRYAEVSVARGGSSVEETEFFPKNSVSGSKAEEQKRS
jgi:molecular chaperone GrpE (heat shock protein)